MKDNLLLHDSELNILNSEGVFRIYDELGVYANIQDVKRPELFDILSCEFGCNHGPASASKSNAFDSMHIMKQIEGEAKKRRKTGVFRPGEDKLFKKFDEELVLDDFLKSFKSAPPSPVLSEKQLDAVYKLMGKETEIRLWLIAHIQNRTLPLPERLMSLGLSLQALEPVLESQDVAALDRLLHSPFPTNYTAFEISAEHLAFGLHTMESLCRQLDDRSDSLRSYGEAAQTYFTSKLATK